MPPTYLMSVDNINPVGCVDLYNLSCLCSFRSPDHALVPLSIITSSSALSGLYHRPSIYVVQV